MPSKQLLLANAKLYVIVDAAVCGDRDPVAIATEAVAGGADVIQWRAKTWPADRRAEMATRLASALADLPALFIINDHLDVALASGADGVHLGQNDLPLAAARPLMGADRLIGISTHSVEQALAAQAGGADYIGVGPVFATPTKPDYRPVGAELLEAMVGKIAIPYFAIGGIDQANLPLVSSCGATRVAVVRAVAGVRDIRQTAHALKTMLA